MYNRCNLLQLPKILCEFVNNEKLNWNLAKLSDILKVRENLRKQVANGNIARDIFKLPSSFFVAIKRIRSNADLTVRSSKTHASGASAKFRHAFA